MKWVCPCCSLAFKSPAFPVRCRCGTVQTAVDALPTMGEACGVPRRTRGDGAGSYLKRFFESVYIRADGKCNCAELAAAMDANGPAWCERNAATIIDALRANAVKRGLPFSDWLARGLLRRAIAYARRLLPDTLAQTPTQSL